MVDVTASASESQAVSTGDKEHIISRAEHGARWSMSANVTQRAKPPAASVSAEPQRVLLISHEASRSGAPRVAALVARSLVARGHHVRIVSRTRGPLIREFAAETATSVEFLSRIRRRFRELSVPRWVPRFLDSAVAVVTILINRPDVVYVNSTAAAIYLRPAQLLRRATILHSHESGEIAAHFLDEAHAWTNLSKVTVVACSPSVQRELAEIANLPLDSVELIPSVPDDARVLQLAEGPSDLDISDGQVVVGCCGSVEHRKGVDLFADAATEVRRLVPEVDIRFIWVGDVTVEGLPPNSESVEFVGPRANPYPMIKAFDIATLPSRDDPFPLVVLEAMLLGRPMVAYDVGAVAEQIGDTGVLVRPGDVNAFAAAIAQLVLDKSSRIAMGSQAHRRAISRYSSSAFSSHLDAVLARVTSVPGDRDSGVASRRRQRVNGDASRPTDPPRSDTASSRQSPLQQRRGTRGDQLGRKHDL